MASKLAHRKTGESTVYHSLSKCVPKIQNTLFYVGRYRAAREKCWGGIVVVFGRSSFQERSAPFTCSGMTGAGTVHCSSFSLSRPTFSTEKEEKGRQLWRERYVREHGSGSGSPGFHADSSSPSPTRSAQNTRSRFFSFFAQQRPHPHVKRRVIFFLLFYTEEWATSKDPRFSLTHIGKSRSGNGGFWSHWKWVQEGEGEKSSIILITTRVEYIYSTCTASIDREWHAEKEMFSLAHKNGGRIKTPAPV